MKTSRIYTFPILMILVMSTIWVGAVEERQDIFVTTPYGSISKRFVDTSQQMLARHNITDKSSLYKHLCVGITSNLFDDYIADLQRKAGTNPEYNALITEITEEEIQRTATAFTPEEIKKTQILATTVLDYLCSSTLSADQYYKQKIENTERSKVFKELNEWMYWAKKKDTAEIQKLIEGLSALARCKNINDVKSYFKKYNYDFFFKNSAVQAFTKFLADRLVHRFNIDEAKLQILTSKKKIRSDITKQEKLTAVGKTLIWIAFLKDLRDNIVIYDPAFEKQYKEYLNKRILEYETSFSEIGVDTKQITTQFLIQIANKG